MSAWIRYLVSLVFVAYLTSFVPLIAEAQKVLSLDSTSSMLIGKSTYIIEDLGDSLTFDDVRSAKGDALFKLYDKDAPNFGNVQLTTWNRFSVVNNSNEDWYLVINNYALDTINFYYKPHKDSNFVMELSGRSLPLRQRKINTGVYVFDLPVARGDTATFYFRLMSYFMQYPLIVMTKPQFIETYHIRDRYEGFFYGFLAFMVIYYLFLYASVREKSYLYYILYVVFSGIMIAQIKGSIHELWGDRFHGLWEYGPGIIAIGSSVTFIFTQHILETKKNAPKLHKVLGYFFFPWYIGNAVLSLFGYQHITSISNQLAGLSGLFVLYATAIVVYRRGYRYARFYIAACWAYFVGVLVFVLQSFMVIPYSVYSNNAIEIGSTIQMIMFAFMLADKMNTFKKDKAQAQENLLASLQENEKLITNQNIMLTTKVEERTSELKQTLSNLQLAQEELKQKNVLITHEKERSDELLLNILPEEVADELKEKGSSEAQHFDCVTVLFTDFEGFTSLSSTLTPQELVSEINEYFSEFDRIMERHNIEKIKTIGDAYMAVGGLPVKNTTHAQNIIQAAFEIQDFMERKAKENKAKNHPFFSCRIGIHSGPVVAGIVGVKKFQYDVWGDTVNTASRFESHGEGGKINISSATKALLDNNTYIFEYRGKVDAKGKGEIEMYFIKRKA